MLERYSPSPESAQPPSIFSTFWQAGFECSTHCLPTGRRLDLVDATRHDAFAVEDYSRLREAGISTVREGLRWHLIEGLSGNYDFSSAQRLLEAAHRCGIEVIWDLLHFGWPDHLAILHPDWGHHFADFAFAFGQELRRTGTAPAFVAPINEISFLSWASGEVGYIEPFHVKRGFALKKVLAKAAINAASALRASLAVRLVWPEPVIQVHGNPHSPVDQLNAAQETAAMYQAWDMISGRLLPELGGNPSYLDILGINFYPHNQWWTSGTFIHRHEPSYRPFRSFLEEISARYRRPLFISETGAENDARAPWLAYIGDETRAAQRLGVRLEGICLYPILNHPGWDDDRHCHNGLWDYPDPVGFRQIDRNLAGELIRQQALQRNHHERSAVRPAVSLPPALELCLPTSAALNEPVCPSEAGVLR